MSRNVWAIISLNLLLFMGAWVYMDLHIKATTRRSDALNEILDATEKDLNTYDSLTAHKMPVYARALKVSREVQARALAEQAKRDSLIRLAEEGMIADYDLPTQTDPYSYESSTEYDYNNDNEYDFEYINNHEWNADSNDFVPHR